MRKKMVELADQFSGGERLPKFLLGLGERYLGFHALNTAHAHIEDDWEAGSKENFFKLACKYLNLHYDLSGLENIPKEGPCVIVSNHPHGMSDGLMFGDVAMQVRDDIRIVVNEWLTCVRGMRPYEITVDVYGGEAAKRANMQGMREILQWLRGGHCILVFPSGSAATYSKQDGRIIDDPWQNNIAALIRKTKASVVPMHISGHTGMLFQLVSRLAKEKRGALLAREIKRDGRMRHSISLGRYISPATYENLPDDQSLSDYLRLSSMLLRYPRKEHNAGEVQKFSTPVKASVDKAQLQAEIDSLPEDALCYAGENSKLAVYAVTASQIPLLLQEIGIQRELTFRAVGEGTGLDCDLDAYDQSYVHLVMWDHEHQQLAGAYRMGRCDQLLKESGIKGIYNSNFFRFDPQIESTLAQGLEMGRAFISKNYQRMPASLDSLWMGIGRYINKHPEYRYLYGTVSISEIFQDSTRALILSYLRHKEMNNQLAAWVTANTPPKHLCLLSEDDRLVPSALPDLRSLCNIVSAIERDGVNVPVLLKQYLRLGGKMISFNVDKDFCNTLDCLVIVDLHNAPERSLRRYRGKDYYVAKEQDNLTKEST